MKITLNGKAHKLEKAVDVAQLLEILAVKPEVAVAINGEIVRRTDWRATVVSDGDVVEIVRAVGGG
ncbi:MAG: sulfur carrier protein ThiS [Dehalococcoidia bacterium]